MERFNLNTWLENKSRKIVTRDGKKVRIICYDVKQGKDDCYVPIIALVDKGEEFGEMSYYYSEDGRFLRNPNQTHNLDLFFADEEEELTELQKTLEEDCDYYVKLYNEGYTREELREWIKCWCNSIIDLARKEIEKSNPYNGKQKQEWSEEDEQNLNFWLDNNKSIDSDKRNWLKSLKNRVQSQPKQEWSEEDSKNLNSVKRIIENSENLNKIFETIDSPEYIKKYFIDWLKSIKDRFQLQPKQEWNKKDENFLESIINDTEQGALLDKEQINWLKSLKDKAQPQPKQEWSEEDEKNWRHCLHYIDAYVTPVKEHVDWYKNIRNRIGWKPSEEQMEALFEAKLASINNREYFLGLLYEDLKKL